MFRKLKKLYFKIYHLFKLIGVFIVVFGLCDRVYAEEVTLPRDYVEVPYIQSNGAQYIDTGIKASSEIEINISAQCYQNFTSTGCYGLYGGGIGWQNKYLQGEIDSTPYFAFNNDVYSRYFTGNMSTYYNINQNKNIVKIDDTTYRTFNNSQFTTDYNIVVFAVNRSNIISEYGTYRIKSAYIKENNILVRNFIPVYRYSNNSYGLYDTVSKTFFGNNGTGELTTDPNFEIPEQEPEPEDNVYSGFLTIYFDRIVYLAEGFTNNPYLIAMIGIIFGFVVLDLMLKIINIRRKK